MSEYWFTVTIISFPHFKLISSHKCRFGYASQYLPIFGTVLWSNEFVSAKVKMIIDSKIMSARP